MSAAKRLALVNSSISLVRSRVMVAEGHKTFPVFNPCTGEKITDVPDAGAEEMTEAIMEAHKSKKKWADMLAWDRAKILKNFFNLLMANQEKLATIVSLETGKPLVESRVEVTYGASFVEWFAEEARRLYGDIVPSPVMGRRLFITKHPIGVAGLITPWNFPVAMILRKAGAALAAGCTCVVKPSEETPLSALAIAELSQQASIPPGVFNVVSSSRQNTPEVVKVLCSSESVQKISFTGSTAIGKLLVSLSADTVKKLSLELGGNAPLIVFDSANVELAVRGLMAAKFRNTGQACISPNRILVQAGIHDKFVEALSEAVSRLKLGDAFEEEVTQGPLINKLALDKVEQLVGDAISKGAKVSVGGSRDHTLGDLFYRPSVLTGANPDMRISGEEIFGPIVPITKFNREEEAINIANATQYGLASYVFSSDLGQIFRVSEAMEAGIVGVNEGAITAPSAPFGGIKQSGFGREGSKYGMDDYIYLKYTCIGGLD